EISEREGKRTIRILVPAVEERRDDVARRRKGGQRKWSFLPLQRRPGDQSEGDGEGRNGPMALLHGILLKDFAARFDRAGPTWFAVRAEPEHPSPLDEGASQTSRDSFAAKVARSSDRSGLTCIRPRSVRPRAATPGGRGRRVVCLALG